MTITTRLEVYPENAPVPMTWEKAVEYCKSLGEGWRLPTKDELNKMYENKDKLGGFGEGWLWSSSQYANYYAWIQRFSDSIQDTNSKDSRYAVRACRAFTDITI